MDSIGLPEAVAVRTSRPAARSRLWFAVLIIAAGVWGWVDVRQRGFFYPDRPEQHKTDFTVYTEAGAAFFDGRPPYEVTNPRGWAYLYPPLFAILLAPLHALPPQDQVLVWYLLSLLACWGSYRECGRLLRIVSAGNDDLAPRCARWLPWLGIMATLAALLPMLNCLQRGQVGAVKLYLLLLGLRLVVGGRSWRAWLSGGVVLAMPVVMKVIPILPVGFLIFMQVVAAAEKWWSGQASPVQIGAKATGSSLGLATGLFLFFFLVPASLVGWNANLRHLGTWTEFALSKADNGGIDLRSGDSRSVRNQSLQNAACRLGNLAAYALAGGPDDRLADDDWSASMATDSPLAQGALEIARFALLLALLVTGVRMARGGEALSDAAGFGLACVAMLVVSPVARGHYFMLFVPAILFLPLWLDQRGMPRAARAMAIAPAVGTILHFVLLPVAGRMGLLGLLTTAWLMAAMLLVRRAGHREATACGGGMTESFARAA